MLREKTYFHVGVFEARPRSMKNPIFLDSRSEQKKGSAEGSELLAAIIGKNAEVVVPRRLRVHCSVTLNISYRLCLIGDHRKPFHKTSQSGLSCETHYDCKNYGASYDRTSGIGNYNC